MGDHSESEAYGQGTTALSPLLAVNAVAALLAVSRQTVYKLVSTGGLHPARVNGRLRFSLDDITDYLDRHREEVVHVEQEGRERTVAGPRT